MKREDLLLKVLGLLIDSDNEVKTEESNIAAPIGEYVIVRCRDAGVHAGYLKEFSGRTVKLEKSRRLWYWKAHREHTLSGVARHGLGGESKISGEVDIILPEICEIIVVSEKAKDSIEGATVYEP